MTDYLLDARTATGHFPGIGRYVRNLATALLPLLSPSEQLTILWNPDDPTAWDPSPLGPRAWIRPAPVSPFSLSQQWRIPRMLNPQSPVPNPQSRIPSPRTPIPNPQTPIYHSTYYLMPYLISRYPGIPTVLTVYDLIAMLQPQAVSLRARLLFRVTTWLALQSAQEVITISQATKDDLLAHFSVDPARVSAIPLAADPRFTPQPASVVRSVRQKYNLSNRYLFYLGINKPHKNLPSLIKAYARLIQSPVPNPQSPLPNPQSPIPSLVIAGAWDDRYPEAKTLAQELGQGDSVRFLGRVDDSDLPALYSGCMAFVFPSLYEGFGLPVLEAMACGAPVACGNLSSLPEVAGEAALLFDPTDVDAIAHALSVLCGDEARRRSLAQASLIQARLFSWQRTAAETLAVYRRLDAEGAA